MSKLFLARPLLAEQVLLIELASIGGDAGFLPWTSSIGAGANSACRISTLSRRAFLGSKSDPLDCENPLILKWWSPMHDQLLSEQISKDQWLWFCRITDKLLEITPADTIDNCFSSRAMALARY